MEGSDVTCPFVVPTTKVHDLPAELLRSLFRIIDVETLAQAVPLVCKAWRDASREPDVWQDRLSAGLLRQLGPLAALGPPVSPAQLHLALRGRNFLRNPDFRQEANSALLPPLGALGVGRWSSWMKWQRTAWVLNSSVGKEVSWERTPLGMDVAGQAPSPAAPPPPLPYPATRRLVSYMQKAMKGLFSLVVQRPNAAEEGAPVGEGEAAAAAAASQAAATGCEAAAAEVAQPASQEGCLATLDGWSEVVQVVDLDWELQRRGLSAAQAAHLLDAELGLRLSVHVGCRADCVGEYAMALLLDEGDNGGAGGGAGDAIPSLQSFVMRPTRHLGYLEREHLTPATWRRFEYSLPACPRGFRRAVVMLRGRRAPTTDPAEPAPPTRFCGAKFASAQLSFG